MLELGEEIDVIDFVTEVEVEDEPVFGTTEEVEVVVDDADIVGSRDEDEV